jgi:hypothetical protein
MRKIIIFILFTTGTGLMSQDVQYGKEFKINDAALESPPGGAPYGYWFFLKPNACTLLSGGGFVLCWADWKPDGSEYDIHAQIFSESGLKVGGNFRVNTYTANKQWYPNIAALENGGFIVCWQSTEQDGSGEGVFAQRFTPDGKKDGSEFMLNTTTGSDQGQVQLLTLYDGRLLAYWNGFTSDSQNSNLDIFGQFLSKNGQKTGGEFRINTYAYAEQESSVAALLKNGNFLFCWNDRYRDGSVWGIFGQMFSANGEKTGGEFQVNTYVQGEQLDPKIFALLDGGFIVSWYDQIRSNYFSQRYSKDGGRIGSEVENNSVLYHSDFIQKDNGDFIACWIDPDEFLCAQSFSSTGTGIGEKYCIDSSRDVYNSRILMLDNGDVLFWWQKHSRLYDYFGKIYPKDPINHTLRAFNLIYPENDQSVKTLELNLSWRQSTDRTVCYPWELHYKVLIDDDAAFSSPGIKELDQDTTVAVNGLQPGTTYFWKILAKNIAGDSLWSSNTNGFFVSQDATSGVEEARPATPEEFALYQNYPNPFNPETSIRFDMPSPGFVTISVYDVNGRLVRMLVSESRTAGSYSARWDGKDTLGNLVPSGIYVCRMEVRSADGRSFTQSVKMGLVR